MELSDIAIYQDTRSGARRRILTEPNDNLDAVITSLLQEEATQQVVLVRRPAQN